MDITEYDEKVRALAEHLSDDPEVITEGYDDELEAYGNRYLVLDDTEADEAVFEYIGQSLWTFDAHFLADFMPEGVTASHIEKVSEVLCDDANEFFLALVGDNLSDLVSKAISSDGRGHFLNRYDGHEYSVEVEGTTYYIYQM